jgi:uncharacterized integral membrane protein (TIGR00698 family)
VLQKESIRKFIFILSGILCLTPWLRSAHALLLGLIVAFTIGNPYGKFSKKTSGLLLRTCVVLIGFGMNLNTALQAGKQGFTFSAISILGTLLLGIIIGKALVVDKKISHLISAGTAICGGSAIAAVSPIVQAEEEQLSVSLGVVFVLNSIALFVFPSVGHWLQLTQQQFGMWSAIAIHDTSSVVGAASVYGKEALEVATTVKMVRTLWIIPVAFIIALIYKSSHRDIKIPWFIGLFVATMIVNTYWMQGNEVSVNIVKVSKAGLRLTLFFIGSGLSKKVLRHVGVKPFVQGFILWVAISLTALWAVMNYIV